MEPLRHEVERYPSSNITKDNSNAKTASNQHSPHFATPSQPSRHSSSSDLSEPWSPAQQPDAMTSAASLISQSSLSSLSTSSALTGTPEPHSSSHPSTASSSTSSLATAPQQTHLSPSGSIQRGTSKRLTPSAILFFRRSSSKSVHVDTLHSSSPPASTGPSHLQSGRYCIPRSPRPSTPPGGHKKTSASLLKGSASRRSLQTGIDEPGDRKIRCAQDTDGGKSDKERAKKEKDRSESRISVLMGRKRGRVRQAHSKR